MNADGRPRIWHRDFCFVVISPCQAGAAGQLRNNVSPAGAGPKEQPQSRRNNLSPVGLDSDARRLCLRQNCEYPQQTVKACSVVVGFHALQPHSWCTAFPSHPIAFYSAQVPDMLFYVHLSNARIPQQVKECLKGSSLIRAIGFGFAHDKLRITQYTFTYASASACCKRPTSSCHCAGVWGLLTRGEFPA